LKIGIAQKEIGLRWTTVGIVVREVDAVFVSTIVEEV
jgi:hypothetical protein